jgi:hypothetical protein
MREDGAEPPSELFDAALAAIRGLTEFASFRHNRTGEKVESATTGRGG